MADRPKHLVVGDDLLWTMLLFDINGVTIDADVDPTFTVRKNGTLLTDIVSVVRRELGTYDCTYSPVDATEEGDQFTIEEFATISSIDYKNKFEFIINATEPTGGGIRLVLITVQDEAFAVVPGAVVNVLDAAGTPIGVQDTTDTLGQARVNLNDGDYKFVISAIPGFQPHVPEPYTVSASQTTPLLTIFHSVTPTEPVEDPGIDTSGIRKVKTKHMEIEAWDPRIMQDVRDRELAPPTFCELDMCRGVSYRKGCGSYRKGCY